MDNDGRDQSPLPDQYARDNNLSTDSQVDPFSLLANLSGTLPRPTPDVRANSLIDDSSLPQFQLPPLRLQEQLEIPKGSLDILGSALQFEELDAIDKEETPLARYDAHKRIARLKLELPILPSDPDEDCRELAKIIQEQRQPIVSSQVFPPERLNTALDESLEFPNSAHTFREAINISVEHEKIDVSKAGLYQLARALKDDWCEDDNRSILEDAIVHRTVVSELAITPPLSPCPQHEECFVPDSKVCEVPVASSPRSLLSDDLKAAKSVIEKGELEELSHISDIAAAQLSPLPDKLALDAERFKIDSIRVESPLLTSSSPHKLFNRGVNVPSLLKSMDIDHALSPPFSSETDDAHTIGMIATHDSELQNTMEQSSASLMRSIEQECINVADTMARVEVPTMDFSISEPKWQALPMNTKAHLDWLNKEHDTALHYWPRNAKADSQLRWVPFMQKIDFQALTSEIIEDEGAGSKLFDFIDAETVPTSADYVWKRPGLAVLYESESEGELEGATRPVDPMFDLEILSRRRRLQSKIDESDSDCSVHLIAPQKKRPLQNAPKEDVMQLTQLLPGADSDSAVSTLLSNYIHIREAKRQKQDKSSFFSHNPKPEDQLPMLLIPKVPRLERDLRTDQGHKPVEQPLSQLCDSKAPAAPCPKLDTINAATKLIKGLTISRSLFARLEQLYPAAEIIERDFDRWDTVTWDHRSVTTIPVALSLTAEADIIISPITGIIMTTLLKTIQKPLPGCSGQSAIRERISRVMLRYERLIVLVSEGNVIDETARDLTPSEAMGYAEFVSFTAGLDSQVMVFYVGGGEATLATWLVFFAAQYAHEAAETQGNLMQDETQWELFLRRAGFNAYAAQAILIRLKAAANEQTYEESRWFEGGLSAFMRMSPDERVEYFRDLVGGETMLNRISRTLETRWS